MRASNHTSNFARYAGIANSELYSQPVSVGTGGKFKTRHAHKRSRISPDLVRVCANP